MMKVGDPEVTNVMKKYQQLFSLKMKVAKLINGLLSVGGVSVQEMALDQNRCSSASRQGLLS
jgi:hypothetical protein